MPVQTNKDSEGCFARWGNEGAKYHYECGNDSARKAAEDKAYQQGKAIIASGGLEQASSISKLANLKVSFDYDDTLTTQAMQKLVEKLITAGGTSVYIISARQSAIGMYALASKLGIPMSRVYATGSNKAKVEKVKELGINKHYDNNAEIIKELPNIGIKI